jgi:DNA repair protein RecN (Recombination protein N)
MLKNLSIRNFALINEASLNFDKGYTVITGETGSGKSILLNALHLLLGERADYKVIGQHGEKAVVEAIFELNETDFSSMFQNNDWDFEKETIIRREITKQGKSRAFVNDVPVQLADLKLLTEQLVSIHSQYNTLELKRKEFQFETLDTLAETSNIHANYLIQFKEAKSISKQIIEAKEELALLERDRDYNEFQLKELEELNIENTAFSVLEEQLQKLENAEEIMALTSSIQEAIGGDDSLITRLQQVKNFSTKLEKFDSQYESITERLQSVIIELKDIESELSSSPSFEYNAENVAQLTEILDKYNRILVKHQCHNEEELKQTYQQLKQFVGNTEELSEKIAQLEKKYQLVLQSQQQLAKELHTARVNKLPLIESTISSTLSELKLPDTLFKFELTEQEEYTNFGNTSIRILFSANKGIPPVEIEKAASGGELSRVMLALQQYISEKTKLPTIFFDEIDTGVSGDVAQKMGNLLQKMGKTMQLFAISHLPQVAAKASSHLKVSKHTSGELTETIIKPLDEQQRIEEIARLMSGDYINEAALSNAKALMS